MGSFVSKLLYSHDEEHASCKKSEAGSNLSTPLKYSVTPPMKRKILSTDPRSASAGISRTPIDVTPTPIKATNQAVSAISRRLQSKPYLETNFDGTLPLSVVKVPLDPRSPNVSEPRTPITLPQKADCEIVEIPEKVLDPKLHCLDPRSPTIDFDRTPILKPKSPLNSHKSIGAGSASLSTCETSFNDLPEIQVLPDIVQNLQISPRNLEDILNNADDCNIVKGNNDNDTERDEAEADPHPSPVGEKEELRANTRALIDNILIKAMRKIEQEKNKKIQIWQDPEIEKTIANEKVDVVSAIEDTKGEEIVIEVDEEEKCESKENKEVKVKDVVESKKSTGQDVVMCRTPLANRSNNHVRGHKKQKNLAQVIMKSKENANNQQENTPPGKKSFKSKLNSTQWDQDTTILI